MGSLIRMLTNTRQVFIFTIISTCLSSSVSSLRCIACSSDPETSLNEACIGGNNETLTGVIPIDEREGFILECTDEDNSDYCFTYVQWEPKFGDPNDLRNRRWSRGCCGGSSSQCSGQEHTVTDWYEIWRNKCNAEDGCNFDAPRGSSSSGGSGGGGIGQCDDVFNCRLVVKAKGNAGKVAVSFAVLVFQLALFLLS